MKIVTTETLKLIDSFIENNKDAISNDLLALVKIPSVRSEAKDGAPFGENCKIMLEQTAKLYESNSFKTRFDKNSNYIISNFENGEKTIGIFSHGDVVPADGEWLICPPFEPIIKDGYIFGRGCNDDKSGIIQALYAAKFIKENIKDFKSNILMYTGANEETGMADIKEFVKNEAIPEFSIVPDGEYPFYCGERSILRFNATSKQKFKSIKDFYGGQSVNIVLGEVTAVIEYSKELLYEIKKACENNERFNYNITESEIIITAKGESAHTANVDKGFNAAKLMADMLISLENIPCKDKFILKNISNFIGDGFGRGFNIEHNDKDFGKLICSNGVVYCTDKTITLSFDIRAGLSFDVKDIEAIVLKSCEQADFSGLFTRSSKGHLIDTNSEFSKLVCDTYECIVNPKEPKTPILTAGGTYARELTNAYSIGTVDSTKAESIKLPTGHGGVHQPDEKLNINGFLEAIKILIAILIEADYILNS